MYVALGHWKLVAVALDRGALICRPRCRMPSIGDVQFPHRGSQGSRVWLPPGMHDEASDRKTLQKTRDIVERREKREDMSLGEGWMPSARARRPVTRSCRTPPSSSALGQLTWKKKRFTFAASVQDVFSHLWDPCWSLLRRGKAYHSAGTNKGNQSTPPSPHEPQYKARFQGFNGIRMRQSSKV